jgi:PleD family two-component response regulator
MDALTGDLGMRGHRTTVLLIDDQAMIGEAVRRMLAAETSVDYHYWGDPTTALQQAERIAPTVVLLDLVMPDVDGLTLLKFFRKHPATRDVPIVVLSSKEEPTTKAEAFALGASDYLVKLPDPIELIARVNHHSRGYIAQIERN